jgi:chromatin remodeling complex protein RSC6
MCGSLVLGTDHMAVSKIWSYMIIRNLMREINSHEVFIDALEQGRLED